jgi:hypothetical protein
MNKRLDRPGHYYGLANIAERIGVSMFTLRRKIAKEHFPAYNRPSLNRCGGYRYEWYTNDLLINQWEYTLIDQAWNKLVRSKSGRMLAYTRESHHADPDMPLHAFTDSDGRWIKP